MKSRRSDKLSSRIAHVSILESRRLLSATSLAAHAAAALRVDTSLVIQPHSTKEPTANAGLPLTSIPNLHSRPGAPDTIYLRFTGLNYGSAYWGPVSNGLKPGVTPAYDTDGDPTTFSTAELSNIREIWQRVSESYSPFEIDVTTQDPLSYPDKTAIRVIIGGDGAWLGPAGGVAYLDAFNDPSMPNDAWVFPEMLANGNAKYTALAASHEAGHTFGLEHHSVYNAAGSQLAEYDPGSAFIGPIMGAPYDSARAVWAYAHYNVSSTLYQDDLAIITKSANGVVYRTDDHPNSTASAELLTQDAHNLVSVTGVLERTGDQDVFSFVTGSGTVALHMNGAPGTMVDAVITVMDAGGTIVAQASPFPALNASLTTDLPAGQYFVSVSGAGLYGDLGQYTFDAQLVQADGVITGVVWSDENFNSLRDTGEVGVADVVVELFKASDNSLVEQVITNSNGVYAFSGMGLGSYYVQITRPSDRSFAEQNVGSNDTIDSDVNSSGRSATITIATLNDLFSADAGLVTPTLGVADASVLEGDSGTVPVVFTISLRVPSATTLTIPYVTVAGTATQGVDYTAASGTLTFAPGETEKQVTVLVTGDTIIEADETFTLHITAPSGFANAKTVGEAIILDDDLPRINIANSSITESNSTQTMNFVVSLSESSPKTITVDFATLDGTAFADTPDGSTLDFAGASGTLTFVPGDTSETISVTVNGDTDIEGDEVYYVKLKNPVNGALGTSQAVGTIFTDDFPSVSVSNASVQEAVNGQAQMLFTVSINTPIASPVTFRYATVASTDPNTTPAELGADFIAVDSPFTLTPNQVSAVIRVPVYSDVLNEGSEVFNLNITDPSGATLVTTAAVGTIIDQPVRTINFDAKTPATYTDFVGNKVTLKLRGPGSGVLSFTGSTGTDAKALSITGTTVASSVIMTTSKLQTSLGAVSITGDIGTFDAPRANLTGAMSISGAARKVRMNFLSAGSSLSIGAAAVGAAASTLQLNRVVDATIATAMPIALLKVNNWTDHQVFTDITAPSIASAIFAGELQADFVVSGDIGTLKSSLGISNSTIRALNINSVQAATIANSQIFAGVNDAIHVLPTTLGDFVNSTSRIGKVTIKSSAVNAFNNTHIAAPIIGTVITGKVLAANGGAFGIAADSITKVTAVFGTTVVKLANLTDPAQSYVNTDFTVRLLDAAAIV